MELEGQLLPSMSSPDFVSWALHIIGIKYQAQPPKPIEAKKYICCSPVSVEKSKFKT